MTSNIKNFKYNSENFSGNVDLKYLLGIMNSKYAIILLKSLYGDNYHIYPKHSNPSRFKRPQRQIIFLDDKILSTRKVDTIADTDTLEAQIDDLVYKFMGFRKMKYQSLKRYNY